MAMGTKRLISTTAQDAADKLGKHLVTIYRRCDKKQIAAVKENRDWRVFLVEVTQGDKKLYFSLPYSALEKILGQEIADIIEEA